MDNEFWKAEALKEIKKLKDRIDTIHEYGGSIGGDFGELFSFLQIYRERYGGCEECQKGFLTMQSLLDEAHLFWNDPQALITKLTQKLDVENLVTYEDSVCKNHLGYTIVKVVKGPAIDVIWECEAFYGDVVPHAIRRLCPNHRGTIQNSYYIEKRRRGRTARQ